MEKQIDTTTVTKKIINAKQNVPNQQKQQQQKSNKPGQGTSRAARKRRADKNAGRKQGNRIVGPKPLQKSLLSSLVRELDLEKSISEQIQTMFNPTAGVFRPFSYGMEQTGIFGHRATLNISLHDNWNFINFLVTPSHGVGNVLAVSIDDVIINPSSSANVTRVAGPFVDNGYADIYRYIGCEVLITPLTPQMYQSGAGKVVYVPELNVDAYTRGNTNYFTQQAFSKIFTGSDRMILHCMPNQYERNFNDTDTAYERDSALAGYLSVPVGLNSAVSFEFDITVFYEYVPNIQYLPLVELNMATSHPDAVYYLQNMINASRADPYCLSPYEVWRAAIDGHTTHSGGHNRAFTATAIPAEANDDIEQADEEAFGGNDGSGGSNGGKLSVKSRSDIPIRGSRVKQLQPVSEDIDEEQKVGQQVLNTVTASWDELGGQGDEQGGIIDQGVSLLQGLASDTLRTSLTGAATAYGGPLAGVAADTALQTFLPSGSKVTKAKRK